MDEKKTPQTESGKFQTPALAFSDLKKGPDGLVPVVVQEAGSGEVLMVAYMNEEAYDKTLESGLMTYWSRSRSELWVKGMTSGHFQHLHSFYADCDRDTLLAVVDQEGAACHTGHHSCFFTEIAGDGSGKPQGTSAF